MRPVLYVILDGLGDRPIPALGGRTPLEAAAVPQLTALARRGRTGLVQTVGVGIAPESDVAVIAILGYDPFTYHTGRGVFEAVGAGIPFRDGDLALRGNFATGKGMQILDRRAGRDLTSEEARVLADALTRDLRLVAVPAELEVRASIGHRCGVVMRRRGGRLSGKITNTDPAYARVEGLGVAIAQPGSTGERCRPLNGGAGDRAVPRVVHPHQGARRTRPRWRRRGEAGGDRDDRSGVLRHASAPDRSGQGAHRRHGGPRHPVRPAQPLGRSGPPAARW